MSPLRSSPVDSGADDVSDAGLAGTGGARGLGFLPLLEPGSSPSGGAILGAALALVAVQARRTSAGEA